MASPKIKLFLAGSVVTLVSLVVSISVSGQTQWQLSHYTIYDNNTFRDYEMIPDWVNQTDLYLGHDFKLGSWLSRVYYEGDVNIFKEYPERFFHQHQLGLAFSHQFGEALSLMAGGNYEIRRNRTAYDYYNYSQWQGYGNVRLEIQQNLPLQAGYRLRGRQYQNLPEFSYQEHFSFLRLSKFLPTKTTPIGEVTYGKKDYTGKSSIVEKKLESKGRGKGWGRHGQMFPVISYNIDTPGSSQVTILARIAQSLTPSIGLSFQYLRRLLPQQGSRILSGQDSGYATDDELFDDPYRYQSHELSLVATQLLPWNLQLKLGVDYYHKLYPGIPAQDSGEDRKDERMAGWLYGSKTFRMIRFAQSLTLYLQYSNLRNRSNDAYFDYYQQVISSGMEWNF
ncbi:MAG: hypothetical protein ONB05_05395 [candidate division KSB1 bacterium]|nr:hypothetical protein [candidate division KSB1 bacterium]